MGTELKTTIENGVITIFLDGKVDGNTSENIQEKVIGILDKEHDIVSFVFDMNEVSYVSSAGLRMFSAISNVCRQSGIEYRLIGLREDILRMFQLTGYATIFKIEVKQEAV